MELTKRRADNLRKSIRSCLEQLRKDGIAQALSMYRSVPDYDVEKLETILDESITKHRERLIQLVLTEIDCAVFERDKINYRIQKAKGGIMRDTAGIRSENKQLKQVLDEFTERIEKVKQLQYQSDSKYEQKINSYDEYISEAKCLTSTLQYSCEQLSSSLQSLRSEIKSNLKVSIRALRTCKAQIGVSKSQMDSFIGPLSQKSPLQQSKQKELQEVYKKEKLLAKSYKTIIDYITARLDEDAIPSKSINDNINLLIDKAREDARCRFARVQTGTSNEYVQQTRQMIEAKIKSQELRQNELEKEGRARRVELQRRIEKAQAEIRRLQAQSMTRSDSNAMSEIEKGQIEYESAQARLDETLQALRFSIVQNNSE